MLNSAAGSLPLKSTASGYSLLSTTLVRAGPEGRKVCVKPRIAIIWTNLGHYHLARIRALTDFFDVTAVELAGFEQLYGWREDKIGLNAEVHTLCKGEWESQNQFSVAVELWRDLSRIKPDAVLVPGYSSIPALTAALWSRLHQTRTVLMSESNADDHPRSATRETMKRVLVKILYDCAIVGGRRARTYVTELGVDIQNVGLGYDVVDNGFFAELIDAGQPAPPPVECSLIPYFLYVGRLALEKNLFALVNAFRTYRAKGGTWSLVVVGDGPLGKQLEEYISRDPSGRNVLLAGFKTARELRPFYARAGCFVLPSVREPWGLVVNEAMASGLPVLVSARCGCSDDLVEDAVNGFAFDPADEGKLAFLLARMAGVSTEERSRMGAASRSIIARYSPGFWAGEVRRLICRQ